MPVQGANILKRFEDINPCYRTRSEGVLRTPGWEFQYSDPRRFPNAKCELEEGEAAD